MTNTPAPIILLVFARPSHTLRTLEALSANLLADQSELIVYADAARNENEVEQVLAVRTLVHAATGFRGVTVIERETNYGLARNIIEGVADVLNQYERVIVLEDDLVTSPYFLTYMNQALERYAQDDRIISIHGYVYPVAGPLPEAFFLPGADCWGWATWRCGWKYFNPDGRQLLSELRRRRLEHAFDYGGAYPYTKMLEDQITGTNDSWAIRWYASAFLLGKLTLYPGRSLVHNIGNDASGTHCGDSKSLDAVLSETPIQLDDISVQPSEFARHKFEFFFKQQQCKAFGSRFMRGFQSLFRQFDFVTALKGIARDYLPPIAVRLLQKMRGGGNSFVGDYTTWAEAQAKSIGYDADDILTKVLTATLKVTRGEAVFERDSVTFDKIEYSWPMLAGLMWAAARNAGKLNVLDFGGALGSSYLQNRKFLEGLADVRWNVVEQPHYVECGKTHIQDKELRFYPTISACMSENTPNVILLSSVLQYLEEPTRVLEELRGVGATVMIIARTPFSDIPRDKLLIQQVPSSIYTASYPMWVFSFAGLSENLKKHWRIIDRFMEPEGYVCSQNGLSFSFEGLLLEAC